MINIFIIYSSLNTIIFMKSFGKGLFWIGFIILMGVVIAYMITMFTGVVAFASWVTALTFCGLILIGGLFMLIERGSERRGEIKISEVRPIKEPNDISNVNNNTSPDSTTIH